MQQAGLPNVPRRSRGTSTRIVRTGNITNSIVVIGDNNRLSLNNEGNAIVDRLASNQHPKIRRRSSPVIIGRPSHAIGLLDREVEKNTVQGALRPGNSIEFYSAEGLGKTTLLRYLSSQLQMTDGLVVIDKGKDLDDLLQELFEAFYHSNQLYKLTQVEYKRRFENIQALILLDNYNLGREETQVLLDILPNCVFVLASNERHLWEQGNAIHLAGLPLNTAIALFEQRLGRQLTQKEIIIARSICTALQGHPLQIIQAAALVHDEGKSLQEVARRVPGPSPEDRILEAALAQLPKEAKSLLALLATLRNAPLPAEHVTAMLQTTQLAPLLKKLLNRGLIKAHSPSYSLTGNLGSYLNRAWDLSQSNETALRHFMSWSARPLSNEQILDAAEAVLATLENAAAANRWREVLQIGVAIEPGLVIGRRWSLWQRLLRLLLRAGQTLGDRAVEAWVLHQLGSRALCLGNLAEAGENLSRALEIRRSIGDRSGASATQHNLRLLSGGTPPRKPPRSNGGPLSGRGWLIPLIGTIVIVTIIILSRNGTPDFPTPPVVEPNTFTSTFTPTPTFTDTPTASPTNPSQTATEPSPTPTVPSSTPTIPSPTPTIPSATPKPVVIDFWPEQDIILSSTCTNLQWAVENATRVYLDGTEVNNSSNRQICPSTTTIYTLFVESASGPAEREVTVKTVDPYPPPGFVSDLGCYPWSYSEGSTYYSPSMACYYPVDTCLQPGVDCGKPAADAWCDLYTPFKEAKSWVIGSPPSVTRYIGSSMKCYFFCTTFESITCDFSK